jgi:hypothetical protein
MIKLWQIYGVTKTTNEDHLFTILGPVKSIHL